MTHNDSRAKKRKSSEAALRQWYEQHSWLSFVKYRPVQLAKAHGALVLDGAQSQADIVKAASGNMEELLTNCLSGTGWGASPSALPVAASRSRSPPSPLPPLAPPGAPAAPAFPRRPAIAAVPLACAMAYAFASRPTYANLLPLPRAASLGADARGEVRPMARGRLGSHLDSNLFLSCPLVLGPSPAQCLGSTRHGESICRPD